MICDEDMIHSFVTYLFFMKRSVIFLKIPNREVLLVTLQASKKLNQWFKAVLRTLSNIYDEAFCKSYFYKKS